MTLTLVDLIAKIRAAQLMSRKNANRLLFGQCEAAILGLVDELNKANCPATDTPRGGEEVVASSMREWRITQNSVSGRYRIEDRRLWCGRWWGGWHPSEPVGYFSSTGTYRTCEEAKAAVRDIQQQLAYQNSVSVWRVSDCR